MYWHYCRLKYGKKVVIERMGTEGRDAKESFAEPRGTLSEDKKTLTIRDGNHAPIDSGEVINVADAIKEYLAKEQ
jgi:hypothetical protein